MNKIVDSFTQKNIGAGYLYFYIHFITEILCFYVLSKVVGNSLILWMAPFIYDAFAFVPQSIIGYLSDKYPKINIGIIGVILLLIGFITFFANSLPGDYTELIILCLGNACIHVAGAEVTLRSSSGKLSHSAIFVSGGSFGVISGKLLAKTKISFILISILALTIIPCIILAEYYRKETYNQDVACKNFNYHNENINPLFVIFLAVFVVIVRGYMGYGIPTSWNKTVLQTILLYVAMGIGKALGGILSDAFGMKKIAIISIVGALPFLLFGDKFMLISLVGITMFSMTMSITLGLLVSVLKKKPGLAFGHTTIGLFLGTAPIFFIRLNTFLANALVISISTLICLIIMLIIIRKDNKNETS